MDTVNPRCARVWSRVATYPLGNADVPGSTMTRRARRRNKGERESGMCASNACLRKEGSGDPANPEKKEGPP
jgi:hypothetical protein